MVHAIFIASLSVVALLANAQQNDTLTPFAIPCSPSVTTVSGTYAPTEICRNTLLFNDNFDYFDMNRWKHERTMAGYVIFI